MGVEQHRIDGQDRPIEELFIFQGPRIPTVWLVRESVPAIGPGASAPREDARRLAGADGCPMADVSEQRPNAPSERARGGLEVSPTRRVRLAARILAVAVENPFQKALPDAKGSVEDLRGDPLVPRALPDQRDQQVRKRRARRLDLARVSVKSVVGDSGDAEAGEQLDDASSQVRLFTVKGEAHLAVEAAMDGANMAFGGVDTEQVAKVVVERDAVGEGRPGLVRPVLRFVGSGDPPRTRRGEGGWRER